MSAVTRSRWEKQPSRAENGSAVVLSLCLVVLVSQSRSPLADSLYVLIAFLCVCTLQYICVETGETGQ